jgi:hypothetical protein
LAVIRRGWRLLAEELLAAILEGLALEVEELGGAGGVAFGFGHGGVDPAALVAFEVGVEVDREGEGEIGGLGEGRLGRGGGG